MQDGNKLFAVIDTNVLVSSLFSLDGMSCPAIVIRAILEGTVIPLYNDEILQEYREVLSRPIFPFTSLQVEAVIGAFRDFGRDMDRVKIVEEIFPDPDDVVFYEVKMSVDDAYLVTGNIKHFPQKPFVVTPTEMAKILAEKGLLPGDDYLDQ